VERRSLNWFERRHRTKGLDLAHDHVLKALDTIALLHQITKSYSEGNRAEVKQHLATLFATEQEADRLRSETFRELSKGTALVSDYREDLLHLVKRLDVAADNAKDAARCIEMLAKAQLPAEILKQTVKMTEQLAEAAQILRDSIDRSFNDPDEAIRAAHKVEDREHKIDEGYLKTKAMFVKYGDQVNKGAMVILDDMVEFIEQTADYCADTADYIVMFSTRE